MAGGPACARPRRRRWPGARAHRVGTAGVACVAARTAARQQRPSVPPAQDLSLAGVGDPLSARPCGAPRRHQAAGARHMCRHGIGVVGARPQALGVAAAPWGPKSISPQILARSFASRALGGAVAVSCPAAHTHASLCAQRVCRAAAARRAQRRPVRARRASRSRPDDLTRAWSLAGRAAPPDRRPSAVQTGTRCAPRRRWEASGGPTH